jgi:hypothetical protein
MVILMNSWKVSVNQTESKKLLEPKTFRGVLTLMWGLPPVIPQGFHCKKDAILALAEEEKQLSL